MSYEAIDAVMKRSQSIRGARTLLMVLAFHADRYGRNVYPSIATLMVEAKQGERQVRYNLTALVKLGELTRSVKAGPGQANLYEITLVDNSVDNQEVTPEVGQSTAPSNKEEGCNALPHGGAITDMQVGQSTAPKHTVKTQGILKGGGEEARARETEKSFAPITKAHSARRPLSLAEPPPGEPKEGTPAASEPPRGDSEGLADIEALLRDPVLLATAGAWLALQERALETLTAGECEALSRSRAAWGGRFSPDDIRAALDKTTLRKADLPHMYLLGVLDEWAKRPANGNGHAHAHGYTNGHGQERGRSRASPHTPPDWSEDGVRAMLDRVVRRGEEHRERLRQSWQRASGNGGEIRVRTREEVLGAKQNE